MQDDLKKSEIYQLVELFDAFRLCLKLCKNAETDTVYCTSIAAQLRALLVDRNKKSPALLLRLLENFSNLPKTFHSPITPLPDSLSSAVMNYQSPMLSTNRSISTQTEFDIKTLPDLIVLSISSYSYSVRDIIEWKVNKFGGAHYSTRLSEKDNALRSVPFNVVDRIVYEVGLFLSEFGFCLANECLYLHVSISFMIEDYPQEHTFLVCSGPRNYTVFWGIGINKAGHMFVILNGVGGRSISCDVDRMIDVSTPVRASVTHSITRDLDSKIVVRMDDTEVWSVVFNTISHLPIISDQFESRLNFNPILKSKQQFGFSLGSMVVLNKAFDEVEAANLANYIRSKSSDKFECVSIEPNTIALKPVGETAYSFEGRATKRVIKPQQV